MANSEVTLLLGEQMAIIYLGVNIALPLVLSAILAFIVLFVVQLSRFVKKNMGRSNSKVVFLTPRTSVSNMETTEQKVDLKEDITSITGNGFIRKRRSSIVSAQPFPSVSSEGSFTSRDQSLPSQSRQSSAKSRTRLIGSSNRVSPITPSDEEVTMTSLSGAWTEESDHELARPNSRRKRKDSDRVLSPSQCHIDDVSSIRHHSVFADDMNACDIW